MSTPTAIGRVSESLRSLLLGEMDITPTVSVTVLAPDEGGGSRRINLFLYRVQENSFLTNQDWMVTSADFTRIAPPPLSLNLYYLLTPYAVNDQNLGNAAVHEVLGEAMRVLHEFPVVPDEYLAGDLTAAREQVRIVQNGIDMEELSQVWNTFSQPFRLSILYEVSVVQLDLSSDRERAIPPRVREIGAPRVSASHRPPVVEEMSPIDGPASTTVTFTGQGLDGWRAYVDLGDRVLVDGDEITGGQFQADLPAGLTPGFHHVRVDVSHLFRRTFAFEVTP